jgi:hypothetical protein
MLTKIGVILTASVFSATLFAAVPTTINLNARAKPLNLKINQCANPRIHMKTITAVNRADCEASIDPTFNVYFAVVNVYKNGRTIKPRASCRALAGGEKVKLILKQHSRNKDAYDVYVCP